MIPASLIPLPIDPQVAARVDALELPFNRHGVDPYGIDKRELARLYTLIGWFYRRYFDVEVLGTGHVPPRGRAMLVGNHSGGVALDAVMVIASAFFELEPPRLAQGMVEKFIQKVPFLAWFTSRIGQLTGLPEHCVRLLEDERLLLVFPEGARGTAKLYRERDSLVGFGTGFVRLALQTSTPIVPFAFVGGGEAIPTVANLYRAGKLLGVPYLPVTPYVAPVPLPVSLKLVYGRPMMLQGSPSDSDEVIAGHVAAIKNRIASLLTQGRALREGRLSSTEIDFG
ncbi:1-acyl-sn-glycerol-3-phosphate acyltransferase [Paraliomyxa miuraensis]|uniref:1-acyl-sn-glycerol-3-phosphate acyltransferase n=1 Tax=Paraliomyxa miuraensis TaxID=376150 RepID=UPI002252E50E|nr:1-acyl-sn-glycerol-3-phosphate acyltransferase [Paraliomyxa miuraensis]MCX4240219.1 1-acyl-sn-glycerol-3-phosphate acyltransferase [Paraliomyxa miuraensis]